MKPLDSVPPVEAPSTTPPEAQRTTEERRVALVAEHSSNAILLLGNTGRIDWTNPAFTVMTGHAGEAVTGRELLFLRGPATEPQALHRLERALAARLPCRERLLSYRREGATFWGEYEISPRVDGSGAAAGFAVVIRDVTEAQSARLELEETHQRLRLAIDGGGLVVWDWDVLAGRVQVNRRWSEWVGNASPVLVCSVVDWEARIHPDDRERVANGVMEHLEGRNAGFSLDYRLVRDDGRCVWVLDTGKVIERGEGGRALRVCGAMADITTRKEAECAHRNRERLLALEAAVSLRLLEAKDVAEALPCVLAELGRGLACPRVVFHPLNGDFAGAPAESLIWTEAGVRDGGEWTLGSALDAFDLMRPPDRIMRVARAALKPVCLERAVRLGIQQVVLVPIHTAGTAWGLLELDTSLPPSEWSNLEEDRIAALAGSLASSMLRERAEQETRRLVAGIHQSRDSIVITDTNGYIQYVNPGFEAATGYTRSEAIGRRPNLLKSGQHPQQFYVEMWRCLKEGETWSGRITNRRKNGSLFTEDVTISPVRGNSGAISHFVAVKRDITRELEQDRKMRDMERMESVGRLAGGIAHDFNNMLAVILGNLDTIEYASLEGDELRDMLAGIREATERSAALTKQLLAYARKQPLNLVPVDLNAEVLGLLQMLGRLVGEDVRLHFTPAENLWITMLDRSQIDQILVNLVVNARDAMNGRGRIAITTANLRLEEHRQDLAPGDYVGLVVQDDGSGMDAATMARIFDPFFTTKGIGRGTGLGLATVAGIVSQSGGSIQVSSELGHGSRFEMLFPRASTVAPFAPKSTGPVPAATATEGRVLLLVEDEPALLSTTGRMLRHHGYRVIGVGTPDEALRIVETEGLVPDLLVTDVIMPGLNGHQLHQRLARKVPTLRCLYISGYPADVLESRGLRHREADLLQKPFTTAQLVTKVEERLALPVGG